MAVDLSQKRIPNICTLPLKNADQSPLVDEKGEPARVRIHSPSSKVWEAAQAARRRKSLKRVREQGGKLEAANAEDQTDKIEFLCAITEEFIGVDLPLPEGESGSKALVRAIYSDPGLGFIRDQLDAAAQDWGAFLEACKQD